jgi:hypothetical protein
LQQSAIAGSPVVFTLEQGLKILRGCVILSGTVGISGGTTSGTKIGEGGPVNLISRIKVTANRAAGSRYPGGDLVDCHPRSLLRYAMTERLGKYLAELADSDLGNGDEGTYPIYLSIPIYWGDATLLNQVQTALNADGQDTNGNAIYRSIQVQVHLASNLASCFAGNDRVLDLSDVMVEWVDKRIALNSDTVPLVQEDHDFLIETTQSRARDNGLPQDGSFTSWLFMAEQGTVRTLADTLLNRITVKAPTMNLDLYAPDIRQQMIDDEFLAIGETGAGLFFLDFTEGLLQNSNPAAGISAEFDVNNPSGANLDRLKVYTRRVYSLLNA